MMHGSPESQLSLLVQRAPLVASYKSIKAWLSAEGGMLGGGGEPAPFIAVGSDADGLAEKVR